MVEGAVSDLNNRLLRARQENAMGTKPVSGGQVEITKSTGISQADLDNKLVTDKGSFISSEDRVSLQTTQKRSIIRILRRGDREQQNREEFRNSTAKKGTRELQRLSCSINFEKASGGYVERSPTTRSGRKGQGASLVCK